MKIKQPKTIHMYRFSKHTNLTQHTYRLHIASTEVSTLFNENQQPKTIHMYRYAALYFSKYTNLTDITIAIILLLLRASQKDVYQVGLVAGWTCCKYTTTEGVLLIVQDLTSSSIDNSNFLSWLSDILLITLNSKKYSLLEKIFKYTVLCFAYCFANYTWFKMVFSDFTIVSFFQ